MVKASLLPVLPLRNRIQHYGWGSRTFLARLQGRPSPTPEPEAELWIGTHPRGTSEVLFERQWLDLQEFIAARSAAILGRSAASRFSNQLPFLFKILAADRPLSLQAHPDLEQAQRGFAAENDRQIPLDSPERSYADPFPKPEIVCALTDFWALKGFRGRRQIQAFLGAIPLPALEETLAPLLKIGGPDGMRVFFARLLRLEKPEVAAILSAVSTFLRRNRESAPETRWFEILRESYPDDIGALSPLFLNLVRLSPSEALFLGPGELHAYLRGAAVELMANSDNVLRGGLTSKRVDLEELIRVLTFAEGPAQVIRVDSSREGEVAYSTPAAEFALTRIRLSGATVFRSRPERDIDILLCIEGNACVEPVFESGPVRIVPGQSVLIPAELGPYVARGPALLYRASPPQSPAERGAKA